MKETVNIFEAEPIEGRIDLGSLAESSETAGFVYDIAPGLVGNQDPSLPPDGRPYVTGFALPGVDTPARVLALQNQ